MKVNSNENGRIHPARRKFKQRKPFDAGKKFRKFKDIEIYNESHSWKATVHKAGLELAEHINEVIKKDVKARAILIENSQGGLVGRVGATALEGKIRSVKCPDRDRRKLGISADWICSIQTLAPVVQRNG